MPSRKREKGRARKEAQAISRVPLSSGSNSNGLIPTSGRQFTQLLGNLSIKEKPPRCDHGRPSADDVVRVYLRTFERKLNLVISSNPATVGQASKLAMEAAVDALSKLPRSKTEQGGPIINEETGRIEKGELDKKLTRCLVSLGTDYLLKGCHEADQRELNKATAVSFATSTMEMDLFLQSDGTKEMLGSVLTNDMLRKFSDLSTGGPRETIRFYAKRIGCGCLDALRTELKSVPKYGSCFNCNECLERKKLLLCSGCRYAQYCSPSCQKAHWSRHKKDCSPQDRHVTLTDKVVRRKLTEAEEATRGS